MKTTTKTNKNNRIMCYLPCGEDDVLPPFTEQIPFEKTTYKKDSYPFLDYIDDISLSVNDENEAFAIINPTDNRKPKYISAKRIHELYEGTEYDREVRVERVKDVKQALEILPRVGVLIMNPFLISAGMTQDETAEMMINLCRFIVDNDLYKKEGLIKE
jgi:hypothetical protein